jgi:Uma2 family endonuclease
MEFDDYLRWESEQPVRYECVEGVPYEKGTSPVRACSSPVVHDQIIHNLESCLKGLGGRVERTGSGGATGFSLSPDLCGYWNSQLAWVAEVLSDSTAAYDRGLKFEQYQRLPSLQEYLLIEQDRVHVDLFRRNAEGLWVLHPAGPGATITLDSLGLSLPIEAFYDDTALVTA